ncbi:hypothetical protein FHW23_003314 [Curtobacterium pusillum]|uniref:Uncharacterized protein n=1 Tax=Curtobacterium pusillum TaxID=69373 RepID=A0AAW3TCT5_9MICO|nr:hypothetical protein [Curtobacterium pusillum]
MLRSRARVAGFPSVSDGMRTRHVESHGVTMVSTNAASGAPVARRTERLPVPASGEPGSERRCLHRYPNAHEVDGATAPCRAEGGGQCRPCSGERGLHRSQRCVISAPIDSGVVCTSGARSSITASASFPMALLVPWLGNHRFDPAAAQMGSDRAGRICLVAANPIQVRARSADRAADAESTEQGQEHGRVARLPGRDQRHQRQPAAVDELMHLRGRASAGVAEPVVRRLEPGVRVVRRSSP